MADDKDDMFKDLERDLEKRRKEEKEKEKNQLQQQLEKHYEGGTNPKVVERAVFIGIILLLAAYVAYDTFIFHPSLEGTDAGLLTKTGSTIPTSNVSGKTTDSTTSTTTTTSTVASTTTTTLAASSTSNADNNQSNNTNTSKLSGMITLTIDSINKEKKDDSLGFINSITFTIDNGKSRTIIPVVNVYAFDSKLQLDWATVSRGEYKGEEIPSGQKQIGSISLTPKSFSNLDLQKNVILVLNETGTANYVTARSDFYIS